MIKCKAKSIEQFNNMDGWFLRVMTQDKKLRKVQLDIKDLSDCLGIYESTTEKKEIVINWMQ